MFGWKIPVVSLLKSFCTFCWLWYFLFRLHEHFIINTGQGEFVVWLSDLSQVAVQMISRLANTVHVTLHSHRIVGVLTNL